MKILHVYKTALENTFGGIEQAMAQQINASNLSDYTYTLLSLSSNPKQHENYRSVRQHVFLTDTKQNCQHLYYKEDFCIASNSISWRLLRDFRKIADQADIIHYHFPWPFADLLHLINCIKKPSLITYHSDIIRQKKLLYLYQPIMHRFLQGVSKIVATSPNYLATSSLLQKYKDKVAVIPIGLNKAGYATPTQERRRYWQQRFNKPFFLFIGVMRYYKGLPILLKAVQQTNFPVVIVGTGPIEKELKSYAKQLNLTEVHFLGQLAEEDKVALLQLCLSVVFPSHLRAEAFGISLLEGAMFGKPLISSEISTGTSFINIHEKTGLVVPPSDPIALRKAMRFIWDNPDQSNRMGQEAMARYWELFTAEKMAASYEKLYQDLLS